MATTIRTPSSIDLTAQRVQVGDTIAFVDKINTTQQKLEQWTSQDWNSFAADVAAVARELEQASSAASSSASAASSSQSAASSSASAANSSKEAAQDASSNAQAANAAAQTAKTQSQILVERAEAVLATPEAIEAATGGNIVIRYTDKGEACYFFKLPAFNCEDIALGGELGTGLHPAFIKNGVAVPYILIGVHLASFKAGEFLSQPGKDPAVSRTYDQELAVVAATGAKFRQMNNYEWAALSLWCMANGYQPLGNTQYGCHHTKRWEVAQRQDGRAPGYISSGGVTITGTGPNSWRHNNAANGIADLVGNIWERVSGLKLTDGVFHIAPDGGDYAESEYINTGVSAAGEEGFFATRPTTGISSGVLPEPFNPVNGKVLPGGKVVLAGGYKDSGLVAAAVKVSTDRGRTWSTHVEIAFPSKPQSLSSAGSVVAVDSVLVTGGVLIHGDGEGGGIYEGFVSRSTDGGVTWSDGISMPLAVAQLEVLPNGVLLAFLSGGGLVNPRLIARSFDAGLTWTNGAAINDANNSYACIMRAGGNNIFAVLNGSIYYSSDYGANLQFKGQVPILSHGYKSFVRTSTGRLLGFAYSSYAYSDDNGATWSAEIPYATGVYTEKVFYIDNKLILTDNGKYVESTNNGATWSVVQWLPGLENTSDDIVMMQDMDGIRFIMADNGRYSVDATTLLHRALAIPASASLAPLGYFWRNMAGERVPLRSGSWSHAGNCGLAALNLLYARSGALGSVGLRLAYRDQ